MIAKYPGTCARTGQRIHVGDTINFFGRGRAELVDAGAGTYDSENDDYCEDAAAGLEPGTFASDRRLARNGLSVVRFSSGHVMTQNSRGRCEDAPCCGCCS